MEIKKGNKVSVEYEGRFENGEVFDSSKMHGGQPLEFVAGSGMLVSGFEKAVIGMKKGEEKEVKLSPEDAYGEVKKEYIQKVPKDKFPKEAKVGDMIGIPTPMGQIPAKILSIEDDGVELDMNHPMAGKTLIFKIKVVDFEDGDFLDEVAGHSCGCGHSHEDSCESGCC